MKKLMFILVLLVALISQSFAGFDLLWYKNIPNTTYIYTVKFSNNSKMILCETDGTNKIYSSTNGELLFDSVPANYFANFSLDDSHLIVPKDNKIIYFNLSTKKDDSYFEISKDTINSLILSKDQKYGIATFRNGFKIWDLVSGKIIRTKMITKDSASMESYYGIHGFIPEQNIVLFSETNKYFNGIDPKGNIKYKYHKKMNLFDFTILDSIRNIYDKIEDWDNFQYVNIYSLSNLGQYICYSYIGTDMIEIYEFPTMKLISKFNLFATYSIRDLKFSSDDKYLIVAQGSSGDNLTQWEVETGKLVNQRGPASYNTLDLSPNDRYIATSGGNTLVSLRIPTTDITNPKENQEILYPNPTNGFVNIKVPILAELKITVNNEIGDIVLIPKFIQTDPNTISIDLNRLVNGIYFLNLTANNFNQTYKVIINK
jgi:WD40 repeat protein